MFLVPLLYEPIAQFELLAAPAVSEYFPAPQVLQLDVLYTVRSLLDFAVPAEHASGSPVR